VAISQCVAEHTVTIVLEITVPGSGKNSV